MIEKDGPTVILENDVIKKKVNLELEVTPNNIGINPYQKWIHLARAIDSWRIFPRVFNTTYIILLYRVVVWYMELAQPTLEQSGLVSVVVGAGAAWFGLYAGTSNSSKAFKGETNE